MIYDASTPISDELIGFFFFFLPIAAAMWFFFGLLTRIIVESQTRANDRRALRWQKVAFRGNFPLGKWRSESAAPVAKFFLILARSFIVVGVLVVAIRLVVKLARAAT